MPPMEKPMTARGCGRCSDSVTSFCSAFTMSRIENLGKLTPGCVLLFDGEDDIPSPRESTTITKYLSLLMSLPGPIRLLAIPADLQPKAVGNTTALDLSELRVPKVRYPITQSRITPPLSSFRS